MLSSIQFQITDLPGLSLGLTSEAGDEIFIDSTAAGFGWSVDSSPSAFSSRPPASSDAPASSSGMDLLTVALHEMGHVLGLPDLSFDDPSDPLMDETLAPGVRRLPESVPARPHGPSHASRPRLSVPVLFRPLLRSALRSARLLLLDRAGRPRIALAPGNATNPPQTPDPSSPFGPPTCGAFERPEEADLIPSRRHGRKRAETPSIMGCFRQRYENSHRNSGSLRLAKSLRRDIGTRCGR